MCMSLEPNFIPPTVQKTLNCSAFPDGGLLGCSNPSFWCCVSLIPQRTAHFCTSPWALNFLLPKVDPSFLSVSSRLLGDLFVFSLIQH